ncbi:MAG TPA: hypothetical protein V6C78_25370 [Crinalium sp.]|jgi:hypothetical protein
MSTPSLPEDDQPPSEAYVDRRLRWQLDESISRRFYEACDDELRSLLGRCEWYTTTHPGVLTLVIDCPDASTNWDVLHSVVPLGQTLEQFSLSAKIRVCPPPGTGTPFEIRVDEISTYRDSLEDGTA